MASIGIGVGPDCRGAGGRMFMTGIAVVARSDGARCGARVGVGSAGIIRSVTMRANSSPVPMSCIAWLASTASVTRKPPLSRSTRAMRRHAGSAFTTRIDVGPLCCGWSSILSPITRSISCSVVSPRRTRAIATSRIGAMPCATAARWSALAVAPPAIISASVGVMTATSMSGRRPR